MRIIVILMGIFAANIALAADLYEVNIQVQNQSPLSLQTPNALIALNYFKESQITHLFPVYTGNEEVSVTIQHADTQISYRYPTANSTELVVQIPSIGFDGRFEGASRTESRRLALAALKEGGYLVKLQSALLAQSVRNNNTDIIAGNPLSLLSNMVRNDFDQQFLRLASGDKPSGNVVGASFNMAFMDRNGEFSRIRRLVPHYQYQPESYPASEWTVSAPLSVVEMNGQESYQAGFSGHYRQTINDNWKLNGGLSYGAAYAPQNPEKTTQYIGFNLSSDWHQDIGSWRLAMGNMVGRYETLKINSYNPDFHHVVYRNALIASKPLEIMGSELVGDIYLIDTHYNGTKLNTDSTQEIGLALKSILSRHPWRSSISIESATQTTLHASIGIYF